MKLFLLPASVFVFGLLSATPAAFASQDSLVTAVYSKVSNGYMRTKMPDGSFKRETYAIGNGGYQSGAVGDHSIDDVRFPTIAGLMAQYLARDHYFLAQNSKSADLLLVISWGTTIPLNDGVYRNAQQGVMTAMNHLKLAQGPSASQVGLIRAADSPDGKGATGNVLAAKDEVEGQLFEMQMFNSMRDTANEHNAALLGYKREIDSRNDPSRFAGAGTYFNDLISDIESERYYVIVNAYDFRAATQEKKKKLLWSTRVSVQAQGNQFGESLMAMVANAARHFGQDSGRLIQQYEPHGKVELGELKLLGMVPGPSMPGSTATKK
jgi:hypothetical protein